MREDSIVMKKVNINIEQLMIVLKELPDSGGIRKKRHLLIKNCISLSRSIEKAVMKEKDFSSLGVCIDLIHLHRATFLDLLQRELGDKEDWMRTRSRILRFFGCGKYGLSTILREYFFTKDNEESSSMHQSGVDL